MRNSIAKREILSIYIDTTVKRKGKASKTSKKSTAASKRKPVVTVEGTLHKPILAIYAGYIFTLHSFYLQFLSLKMMGCALNVRAQLTMNTGWHVTSATCGATSAVLIWTKALDQMMPGFAQYALTSKPSRIHLNWCFAGIYC